VSYKVKHIQDSNFQKISGRLTSAYSLSSSLHTGDSASLTTAGGGGVETDPPGYPRASCFVGGGKQTTRGVQPPPPPAIQTLSIYGKHWVCDYDWSALIDVMKCVTFLSIHQFMF
jgi:hypothetical protein